MKIKRNWQDMSLDKLARYSNDLFESLSCQLDDEDVEVLNHLIEVERGLAIWKD